MIAVIGMSVTIVYLQFVLSLMPSLGYANECTPALMSYWFFTMPRRELDSIPSSRRFINLDLTLCNRLTQDYFNMHVQRTRAAMQSFRVLGSPQASELPLWRRLRTQTP